MNANEAQREILRIVRDTITDQAIEEDIKGYSVSSLVSHLDDLTRKLLSRRDMYLTKGE